MPYVYRRQQPFSLLTAGNRSLIAWYDNSNIIYGPSKIILNNTLNDKGVYHNNLTAKSGLTIISSNYGIRKFTLSNGTNYTNNTQIEFRNPTISGISFFFVGAAGYTLNGQSLISIYDQNIFSVDNNNIINIADISTEFLLVNGNSNIVVSGKIPIGAKGEFYINGVLTNTINDISLANEIIFQFQSLNIGSSNTIYNTHIFNNQTITLYLPTKGSNIYNKSLNTIDEVILYNNIISDSDFQNIHSYLLNKWNIISPNVNNIQNIPHLLSWYNLTNQNNTVSQGTTGGLPDRLIILIYDSSGLNNHISKTVGQIFPIYDDNLIGFNFSNIIYSSQLFIGTGSFNGLTISMVLKADFNVSANEYVPIISIRKPINDSNITIFENKYKNIYSTNSSSNNINIGFNNSDLYVLTLQYQDYGNYQTSQIFINSRPMLQSSYNNMQWISNELTRYDINFGGIQTNSEVISCQIKLGETLIYKKLLNPTELAIVHTHLLTNYSISSSDPTNYLIWFDAFDLGSSAGNSVISWTSKDSIYTLINGNFPLVRKYNRPNKLEDLYLVDFNNGPASYFYSIFSEPIRITANILTIFLVTTVNTEHLTDVGSLLKIRDIDNNIIQFKITSDNIFQITGNPDILSHNFIPNIVPTIFVFKSYSRNMVYSIPNSNIYGDVDISTSFKVNDINYIEIGSNCKNSIGDVLIYNRQLVQNEEVNILSYLQNKWAMPTTLQFPNDYSIWFDPEDIDASNWQDKTNKIILKYSGSDSPSKEVINNVTYYRANGTDTFYNESPLLYSTLYINGGGSYTYFVVNGSNINSDQNVVDIFGISSSFGRIYGGCTSLRNNTQTSELYPTSFYYSDLGSQNPSADETLYYNQGIIQNTPSDIIYISCVTCSDGNYTINTKGSINEGKGDFSDGTIFNSDILITIGGFKYKSGTDILDNISPFEGLIGDVIFYTRVLNDIEKLSVFQYLEGKYYK